MIFWIPLCLFFPSITLFYIFFNQRWNSHNTDLIEYMYNVE